MVIYNKEILHWGDENICDYLKQEKKEVVIYGMGLEGEAAYTYFKANQIPVKAIADGSPQKKGKVHEIHTILSYEEMAEKADNTDLICITIANETIYSLVRNKLVKDGFQTITKFCPRNLAYFLFHQNFNIKIPTVLVGVTPLSKKIRQHLEAHQANVFCFVEYELEEEYREDGLPVHSLHNLFTEQTPMNFILGTSVHEYYIMRVIEEKNINAFIYRGVSAMGDFSVGNYTYTNTKMRCYLSKILSNLHFILETFPKNETKVFLKNLVKASLTHMREEAKPLLTTEELNELLYIEDDSFQQPPDCNIFCAVETNPKEFFAFMYRLYDLILQKKKQVSLIQNGEEITVKIDH